MKKISVFIVSFLIFLSAGCSKKILNPYKEDFGCPEGFKGDCSSVRQAYDKSVNESERFSPIVKLDKDMDKVLLDNDDSQGISAIDNEVVTPKVSKIKKYRVFIPGYIGEDNIFYGKRHVYFIVDTPKWIIRDN